MDKYGMPLDSSKSSLPPTTIPPSPEINVQTMQEDIETLTSGPALAQETAGASQSIGPAKKSRAMLVVAVVVLCLIALGVLGYFFILPRFR